MKANGKKMNGKKSGGRKMKKTSTKMPPLKTKRKKASGGSMMKNGYKKGYK